MKEQISNKPHEEVIEMELHQIVNCQQQKVNISKRIELIIENEKDQKIKKMTEFVNMVNRLVDEI